MAQTKKINIFLQDKVHTDAKIVCVLKKTTLNQFLEKAILEAVQQDHRLLKQLVK